MPVALLAVFLIDELPLASLLFVHPYMSGVGLVGFLPEVWGPMCLVINDQPVLSLLQMMGQISALSLISQRLSSWISKWLSHLLRQMQMACGI